MCSVCLCAPRGTRQLSRHFPGATTGDCPRVLKVCISPDRRRPPTSPRGSLLGPGCPWSAVLPHTGQEAEACPRGARLGSGRLGFPLTLLVFSPCLWVTLLNSRSGWDGLHRAQVRQNRRWPGHGRAVVFGVQLLKGSVGPWGRVPAPHWGQRLCT